MINVAFQQNVERNQTFGFLETCNLNLGTKICYFIVYIFRFIFSVTTCNRAEVALSFLRDNKNGYDVVISDVHMPDMDGFKLLEHVGLEMNLPVISQYLLF